MFINRLHRADITILSAKWRFDGLDITIPANDSKNLFAICEKMCYNIILGDVVSEKQTRKNRISVIKSGAGGFIKPALGFIKRVGLVLGVIVFISFAIALDNVVLGYSLDQVPLECRSGVMRSLETGGAVRLSKFSSLNMQSLANGIVKDNADISFASVYKRGSFIVVQTVSANNPSESGKISDALSPCDGVVESIAVFRGTPLVQKGQEIKAGQPLVGCYFTAGEQVIPTAPVYEITLKGYFTFVFNASQDGEYFRSAAVAVAMEKCPETNIIDKNITVAKTQKGYRIEVKLTYLKVLGG